jgi:class 3 adenylate cyclase
MATQTATILVSDLAGSTALRAEVGEDRAEELRRLHDRALVDAAERNGGVVVKGLGDGVLVRFAGAAEALATAVAMQQAVDALGRRERLVLAIRVGVSAGDVTLEDGDCFGTPVVEASRLCSAAGDGEIFAADLVTLLARGRGGHELTPVGDLELKGLPDPVPVQRVGWEPVRAVADLRGAAPYVGREEERQVLRDAFERGGLVLVAGEPGIGKTRLVTEVCHDLEATVLLGGCHDGEVGAYAPFVEAFSDWLQGTPTAEVERVLGPEAPVVARLVPAVDAVLPGLPAPADLPPADAEARLVDALSRVLARLTDERPAVLVLDDLHWADAATVGLLRALARKAVALRLLMVGTYRDTDLDRRHPLAEALPLLRREVEPTRLALHGLPASAVRELLERLADHEVPEAFAELLTTQTDGNPFFLREMLIHLTDVGALRFEDGVWVAADDLAGAIPEGVREVVGRRLSQLPDEAQRLLGVGALFEVAFPLSVTAEVAGLAEDEALDAVDAALAAQVVQATEAFDHYAFTHALFRQTLVGELNPSRQVRLHRSIAEALEKQLRGEPTPAEAAVLSRHWHQSAALPGAERGVAAAVVVADDAVARYAHREAFDAYGVALELLPEGDERTAGLLQARAESGIATRAVLDEVLADVRRLVALVDEPADVAGELVVIAWGVDDRRAAWAIAALGRPHLDPARRDLAWVRLRQAELQELEYADPEHAGLPHDDEARRELQSVMEELDPELLVGIGFIPSSRAMGRRLLGFAPSLSASFMTQWFLNDLDEMVVSVEEALAGDEWAGNVSWIVVSQVILARVHAVQGRHEASDVALAEGLALLDRLHPDSNAAFQAFGAIALINMIRGERPQLLDYGELRRMVDNPDARWAMQAVVAANARAEAVVGDAERAMDLFDEALVGVRRAPGNAPNYPLIIGLLAGTLWVLDRTEHVDAIEENLRHKVLEPDLRYAEAIPPLSLAQLCALTGRDDEARQWVAAARAVVEEQGSVSLRLPIEEFEGEWALRRGDTAAVAAAVERMRAEATHPAMAPWLDRAAELEAQASAG